MDMNMDFNIDCSGRGDEMDVVERDGDQEFNESIGHGSGSTANKDNDHELYACDGSRSEQWKPYIGMQFKSQEDALEYLEYYNLYAKRMGFGVRKSKIYHSKTHGCITSRKFVCEKQGFKEKDKRRDGKVLKPRRDTTNGCMAMMGIKLRDVNIWVVDKFNEEHTHNGATPSKVNKIRSHKMSTATKSLIETFHQSMGPAKISTILTTLDAGGNVVVSQQDTRNYLKRIRKNNIGQECMTVVRSFMDRRTQDDGFFFEVEIDEKYRMRSIFWVDSRSQMSYQQFGDVVVFDTTYKTNGFSMSFAPFTSVNHHRQSILFGCALLADETEESFVWLFETWLKAMRGRKPVSIITDQCGAMAKAIQRVLPDTKHRLCMWHIGQNEIKHLNQIKEQHKSFEADYSRCKWSQTIEEFEISWDALIRKYELHDNTWLKYMYDARDQWIQCYLKNTFFAGMTTTQRSESMNSFFDGYVNAKTPLDEFVKQYDLALMHRRDQENHEDHVTLHTKPVLWSKNPLELQAGNVYTRRCFELFQDELRNKETYFAIKQKEEGFLSTFGIGIYGSDTIKYTVNIDERNESVTCSCKKFEFEGFLCAHVLKVYQKADIMKIPSKYILTRWTIESRYGHIRSVGDEIANSDSVTPMLLWNLREAALKCIDLGMQSMDHYKVVMPILRNCVENVANVMSLVEESGSVHVDNLCQLDDDASMSEHVHMRVLDPHRSITKGRPKNNTRIHSSIEANRDKSKQRMCGHCKKKGHYNTTCPERKHT